MKKLFMLLAIAMMATVGMSARENARFVAPKSLPLGEVTEVLIDSSHWYYYADLVPSYYDYYTYDDALRQIRFEQFTTNEEDSLYLSKKELAVYGEDGRKKYLLNYYAEEDYSMVLNDSCVYAYIDDIEIEIMWLKRDNDFVKSDSNITQYNEAGNETRFEEYLWDTTTATHYWKPGKIRIYTYGVSGRLEQTDTKRWNKDSADWVNYNRTLFIYDEDGKLKEEVAERFQAAKWKTTNKICYVYDEYGNLASDTVYTVEISKSDTTLTYKDRHTYYFDMFGKQSYCATYNWDDEEWQHDNTQQDYYSEHTMPSAIENLNDNDNLNDNRNSKFFHNGQLYIRRGEVIYDAQGQVVE